jgi:hypothetical protein
MDDVIEKVDGAIKSDECQMVGTAGSPLGAGWCLRCLYSMFILELDIRVDSISLIIMSI